MYNIKIINKYKERHKVNVLKVASLLNLEHILRSVRPLICLEEFLKELSFHHLSYDKKQSASFQSPTFLLFFSQRFMRCYWKYWEWPSVHCWILMSGVCRRPRLVSVLSQLLWSVGWVCSIPPSHPLMLRMRRRWREADKEAEMFEGKTAGCMDRKQRLSLSAYRNWARP